MVDELGRGLIAYIEAKEFLVKMKKNNDDYYRDWACFLLQQSMELMIKGIIKTYGEDYKNGHFLMVNTDIIRNLSNHYKELLEISDTLKEIDDNEIVFSQWETKSRYSKFTASSEQIQTAINICEALENFIKKYNL